jgi:hypothetical protein
MLQVIDFTWYFWVTIVRLLQAVDIACFFEVLTWLGSCSATVFGGRRPGW